MSNLFDYLSWRGDLPLEVSPFNDVDALALCQLAYIPYEKVMEPGERTTLRALWERTEGPILGGSNFAESNQRFFEAAAQTVRFGGLTLERYAQAFDETQDLQFAAVTFLLPQDFAFVAFRGTDRTLVGWKEDFKLATSEPVPAQRMAAAYLTEVLEEHIAPVLVGGHSKGGNLALYAAAVTPEEHQRHLAVVYVNDGPGLTEDLVKSEAYAQVEKRLKVFLPQQSLFGLLLTHPKDYTIVKSSASGLLQHDPYSWQILGTDFVKAEALDKDSLYWETVFRKWLADTNEEEYEQTVDVLFRVVRATEATTIKEILPRIAKNPKALITALREVDPPTRQKAMSVLGNLAGTAWHEAEQTYGPKNWVPQFAERTEPQIPEESLIAPPEDPENPELLPAPDAAPETLPEDSEQ